MERKVTITYFGMLEEALGTRNESIDLIKGSVNLRELLLSRHDTLKDYTFSIAVDMEYREIVNENEIPTKIDVMPPFAGG